jgi:hypothetical protein
VIDIVAAAFIMLHTIDGLEVSINPAQVTSLHAKRTDRPNNLLTDRAVCVVGLTDGKFVTVIEDCASVRAMIK